MKVLFMNMFILIGLLTSAGAQRICPLDGQIGVIHIDAKTKVVIKTIYVDGADKGAGGIFEFILEKDTLKVRSFNYDYDTVTNQSYSIFYDWPEFIKIRNNNFKSASSNLDSLVQDNRDRILEVYSWPSSGAINRERKRN